MTPTTELTTRMLIRELAEIEERMHALRAAQAGSREKVGIDPELVRLAGREEHVLAQLRRRHAGHHGGHG